MLASLDLGCWPPILPALLDGETLYSWCGAVHRRSVCASVIETSRRLFGSPAAGLLHDFPAHLTRLEDRTEGRIGKARELALRHSLLGYFLPFFKSDAAEGFIARVIDGALPDLKMRLGIPASGLGGYHPLRCCKVCVERDVRDIGRAAWYVHHQTPSALVCAEHARPLIQTWHRISPVHRREWLVPCTRLDAAHRETVVPSDEAMPVLVRLAQVSRLVFEWPPGSLAPTRVGRVYRRWANSHDALTRAGSIRHGTMGLQIEPQFRWIAQSFAQLGPVACELSAGAVIAGVARHRPKPVHPAKHLALLASMFDSVEDLARELGRDDDAVADSDSEAAATREGGGVDPTVVRVRGLADFVAAIHAGASIPAAARSVGVSTTTGVRWAHREGIAFTARAKSLTPELLQCLRATLSLGEGRVVAAEQHGVSLTSVNRLLSTDADLLARWNKARHEAAQQRHRRAIEDTVRAQPGATAKQIRHMVPASWTWLYRHDSAWLADAMPSLWTSNLSSR